MYRMKNLKRHLYGKHFVEPLSIGKLVAIGALYSVFFTEQISLIIAIMVLVGFAGDMLFDRYISWNGQGTECPLCLDGVLKKIMIKEERRYKGKILNLPEYELVSCLNCDGQLIDTRIRINNDGLFSMFKRKIDKDGE